MAPKRKTPRIVSLLVTIDPKVLSTTSPDNSFCAERRQRTGRTKRPIFLAQVKRVRSRVCEYTQRSIGCAPRRNLAITATVTEAALKTHEPNAPHCKRRPSASRISLQQLQSWSYRDDSRTLGHRIAPLHRVGVYVPGGKAAYPSSG
jgi:histidinol dehydrogenase